MKTKLTSLALLIPAVVLAQQAIPPQPQAVTPQPNLTQIPPNPAQAAKANKAASALSHAKKLIIAKKLGKEVGEGAYDSWTYTTGSENCPSGYHLAGVTNKGERAYCSDAGPGITTIYSWGS